MSESSGEKTEDATPKRMREARRKGQVAKSKDLETVFVLIAVVAVLFAAFRYMGSELAKLMNLAFTSIQDPDQAWSKGLEWGKMALTVMTKITAPAVLAGFLIAGLVGYLQVGPIFTFETLKPQGKKLNPIEGIKNMFKAQTFMELIKNILKIFFIFLISYKVLAAAVPDLIKISGLPIYDFMGVYDDKHQRTQGIVSLTTAASLTGSLISQILIKVFLIFIVIAVIDFMMQRHQFKKQMRMSKEEVKQEYKQDEGDPHIKGHRKALHREMVFSDVQKQVKDADAVVTNPVHVAVAIKYDREKMSAPEIVAKGQRLFADTIRKIAQENSVPMVRNVPLAWSLLELEIGDEVPEELYNAIAEVLSIVYRMKQQSQGALRDNEPQYV